MTNAIKLPKNGFLHVNGSNLHDIIASGNLTVWNAEKDRMREAILSGKALKLGPYPENCALLVSADDLITTIEQYDKWINAFESACDSVKKEGTQSSNEKKEGI